MNFTEDRILTQKVDPTSDSKEIIMFEDELLDDLGLLNEMLLSEDDAWRLYSRGEITKEELFRHLDKRKNPKNGAQGRHVGQDRFHNYRLRKDMWVYITVHGVMLLK